MTAERPQVTLHWLNTSRAQSFVWLLEECKDVDYNIEVYKRDKDMLAPADLKKIHPLGKSPIVTIKTTTMESPLVLVESANIMEYLCHYFAPHLVPGRYQDGKDGQVGGETEQWLRYRHFMHYAEGSLMPLLIISIFMDGIRNAPVPFFIKPIVKAIPARVESMFLNENFKTHFSFLESQIASSPGNGQYLCGKDLTAADILISFPLLAGRSKIDKATYPKLTEYINTLEQNEGYQRSIKKIEEVTNEPFQSKL